MKRLLFELVTVSVLAARFSCSYAADNITLPIYEIAEPIQGLLLPGFHSNISSTTKISRYLEAIMVNDGNLYMEYDQYSYSSADVNPLLAPSYVTSQSTMKKRLNEVAPSMKSYLSYMGYDPYLANDMLVGHPYIISSLLEQNCIPNDYRKLNSIDTIIRQAALEKRLQIRSLETIVESFISVKAIPEQTWNKLLVHLLRSIKSGNCKMWSADYLSAVEQQIFEGRLDDVRLDSLEFHKKIYGSSSLFESYISAARNRAQVQKIASIYANRNTNEIRPIFLIGAAHFSGKHGILRIMCDMGWKIRGTLNGRNIYSCN